VHLSVDREYYPDSYDITVKMQSKLFASISPILELARQQQFMSAAEVMALVASSIVNSQLHSSLLYLCYSCTSLSCLLDFMLFSLMLELSLHIDSVFVSSIVLNVNMCSY